MKYSIVATDFKEHRDEGPWRSYDLETEGNTLKECLANAVYVMTDQDGGELGHVEADDAKAEAYIREFVAAADKAGA